MNPAGAHFLECVCCTLVIENTTRPYLNHDRQLFEFYFNVVKIMLHHQT